MKQSLFVAAALLLSSGAAHAGDMNKVQAQISVDTATVTDQASASAALRSIEMQAKSACRYEKDSVLANMYDKSCAADLVQQVLGQLSNSNLDRAYMASRATESAARS